MKKEIIETSPTSVQFSELEDFARQHIQKWLQELLEQEVTEFFGRGRYERQDEGSGLGKRKGHRNGYGKPRNLTTRLGTVEVRRPRVRGLEKGEEEQFESKVLPLFASRTEGLDETLVKLYLHGLSLGDFELALRGLLGAGVPLSASSLARLKQSWVQEFEDWKQQNAARSSATRSLCRNPIQRRH